jgi:hypothetical protein
MIHQKVKWHPCQRSGVGRSEYTPFRVHAAARPQTVLVVQQAGPTLRKELTVHQRPRTNVREMMKSSSASPWRICPETIAVVCNYDTGLWRERACAVIGRSWRVLFGCVYDFAFSFLCGTCHSMATATEPVPYQ